MTILIHMKNLAFAKPAVVFGGLIARLSGTGITLLRTWEAKTGREEALLELEAAEALLPGLEVKKTYRETNAFDGILAEVREHPYQMIVIRARRAIRYRQRLGRKVARLIAIESPIPVLLVKTNDQTASLRKILICSGGKDVANPVIEKAAILARAAGAELTLLHITTPVPSMYTGMDEIEETFKELLQTDTPTARHLRAAANYLSELGIKARLEIRQGDVTDEILQESKEGEYDLIVIGAASGDNRLKEWFMGDVTRTLVNHISCPILVMR